MLIVINRKESNDLFNCMVFLKSCSGTDASACVSV